MDSELNNLVNQIVNLVNPKKIVLFGSRAKNTSNIDSDYDLLVIVEDSKNNRKTLNYIYKNLSNVKISYDIVLASQETISKYSEERYMIYYHAIQDGIDLYAA